MRRSRRPSVRRSRRPSVRRSKRKSVRRSKRKSVRRSKSPTGRSNRKDKISRRNLRSNPPKGRRGSRDILADILVGLQASLTGVGVTLAGIALTTTDEFSKYPYAIYQMISDSSDFSRKISRPCPDGNRFNDLLLLCIQLAVWDQQRADHTMGIDTLIRDARQRAKSVAVSLIQSLTETIETLGLICRTELIDDFDLALSLLLLDLRYQCPIKVHEGASGAIKEYGLVMQRMQGTQDDVVCVLIPFSGAHAVLATIGNQMQGFGRRLLDYLSSIPGGSEPIGTSGFLKSVMLSFLISSLTMAVPQSPEQPRILRYVWDSDLIDVETIKRVTGFDKLLCNNTAIFNLNSSLSLVHASFILRMKNSGEPNSKLKSRMKYIPDIPDKDVTDYSEAWLVAMILNNIIRLGSGRTIPYTTDSLQIITTELSVLCSTIRGYSNPFTIFCRYVGLLPVYMCHNGSAEMGPFTASQVAKYLRNGQFNLNTPIRTISSKFFSSIKDCRQVKYAFDNYGDRLFTDVYDNSHPSMEYFIEAIRTSIAINPHCTMEAIEGLGECDEYSIKFQTFPTDARYTTASLFGLRDDDVDLESLEEILVRPIVVDRDHSCRIIGSLKAQQCDRADHVPVFVALRETFSGSMEKFLKIMQSKADKMAEVAAKRSDYWPVYWPRDKSQLGSTVNPFMIVIRPSPAGDSNGVEARMMLQQRDILFAERSMGRDTSTQALYSDKRDLGPFEDPFDSNISEEARLLFTATMTVLQHTGVLATISQCQESTLVVAVGDTYFNRRGRDGTVHQDSSGDGEAFSVCTSLDMTEFQPDQIRRSGEIILGLSGSMDPASGILHPSEPKEVITTLQRIQLSLGAAIQKDRAGHPITVSVESSGPGITSIGFTDRLVQHSTPLNFSRFLPMALFQSVIALMFNGPNLGIWSSNSTCVAFISKINQRSQDLVPYDDPALQAASNMEDLIKEVISIREGLSLELGSAPISPISMLDFVKVVIDHLILKDREMLVELGDLLERYNCDGNAVIGELLKDADTESIVNFMKDVFQLWKAMEPHPTSQAGIIIFMVLGYSNVFPIGAPIYTPPSAVFAMAPLLPAPPQQSVDQILITMGNRLATTYLPEIFNSVRAQVGGHYGNTIFWDINSVLQFLRGGFPLLIAESSNELMLSPININNATHRGDTSTVLERSRSAEEAADLRSRRMDMETSGERFRRFQRTTTWCGNQDRKHGAVIEWNGSTAMLHSGNPAVRSKLIAAAIERKRLFNESPGKAKPNFFRDNSLRNIVVKCCSDAGVTTDSVFVKATPWVTVHVPPSSDKHIDKEPLVVTHVNGKPIGQTYPGIMDRDNGWVDVSNSLSLPTNSEEFMKQITENPDRVRDLLNYYKFPDSEKGWELLIQKGRETEAMLDTLFVFDNIPYDDGESSVFTSPPKPKP